MRSQAVALAAGQPKVASNDTRMTGGGPSSGTSHMKAEGATPTSLGFGVERHIQKSRAATDANEKVEHLTCALEALLLHLKYL